MITMSALSLHKLDSSIKFEIRPDNGSFKIAGAYALRPGARLLLGINFGEIPDCPPGFSISDGGFYYRYLPGTGGLEEFSFDFKAPSNSPITMFLRRWYDESPALFGLDSHTFSNYIFVHGSCVSRDLFELPGLSLAGYRARTSLASLSSQPLSYEDEKLSLNKSGFQRRMVKGDLEKTNLDLAKSTPGNYVLVDLIDERLPLRISPLGIYTASPEYNLTGLNLGGAELRGSSNRYYSLFQKGWEIFSRRLRHKAIILNRVYWATHREDGTKLPDQARIAFENDRLSRLYSVIETLTPSIFTLDYTPEELLAATSHRWGVSPYHYSQTTNQVSADQLRSLVSALEHVQPPTSQNENSFFDTATKARNHRYSP